MKSLNQYDYLVIIVYMVMMVGIGVYFSRFMKGAADYFKAGNKLTWWIGGLSSFMSAFSVWMFTGGAGKVYQEGLTGALYLGMTGLGTFTGYLLFARLWRRSRVTTILEYLEERFNLPTHQIASWTYVPFSLLYSGTALFALSIFIAAALGLEETTSVIWIGGLIIVAYTLLGGLWAVSVTDAVQFLVLLPVCLLLVPLSLAAIGGPGRLFADAPAGYFSFPSEGLPWHMIVIYMILLIHGQNTNPIAQRYFSARDEKEARRVSLLCSSLFVVGIFFWAIPPMCARILYPDLGALLGADVKVPHEQAYVVMALRVLPHGLIGLLVSAMFAATMSSLDSCYNVMSAIVSKDIGQRLLDRSMGDRTLLRVGREATLAIGLCVIALGLYLSRHGMGAFDAMMTLSVLTGPPLAAPMLLGFLYRKAPAWAGLFSFLCSGATSLLFALHGGLKAYLVECGGDPLYYTVAGFSVVSVAVVTFLISPLVFRSSEEDRRRIDGFFKKLDTPVDVEKEVPPSEIDKVSVARFIGTLGMLLGGLVVLLALIPGTARDRLINFGTGACIFAFGLWMYRVGRSTAEAEGAETSDQGRPPPAG